MKFLKWLATTIEAPDGTISSARVMALVFGIVGCQVALADPSAWQTVGELVGGGAVSLLLRVKAPRTIAAKKPGAPPPDDADDA